MQYVLYYFSLLLKSSFFFFFFSYDPKEWPIIEPLPSYGRGRERLGGRHISLIHGDGLTNVVITGTRHLFFLNGNCCYSGGNV